MEESCLDSFLSLIFYKIQDHTSKAATAHSDLGRTMSLTNQKDAPGQHDGGIFSTEISLSHMTLGYANLTKTNQHEQCARYQKSIWTYIWSYGARMVCGGLCLNCLWDKTVWTEREIRTFGERNHGLCVVLNLNVYIMDREKDKGYS